MASQPNQSLPLFYQDLVPLNTNEHTEWRSRKTDKAPWLAATHAVPLTVEEFPQAQRHFPIVFSSGDTPVPLALMGLNDGVNTFLDAEGGLLEDVYIPAYARRYPFMLAKLQPEGDELSLCFDPTTDLVGKFDDGEALFADGKPTDTTQGMLEFCRRFEEAAFRTGSFVEELQKHNLLMDGEVAIRRGDDDEQPFVYGGFKMVDENKLRELRGDVLRTWNQNGLLPLIFAHLFSLELIRVVFGRQVSQGKGPIPAA
jgi:hypothetical protein